MAERAQIFISAFNRIEKWMQNQLKSETKMGFSQMVRKLARRSDLPIKKHEDDLLQLSQLRNAIVHDQIGEDFVIAEPNDWVITRIQLIEKELFEPEKVLPRFAKKVTGFTVDLPLEEMLSIVAKERYSQFPLYRDGEFKGLLTLRILGFWFAKHYPISAERIKQLTASDLLEADNKTTNYQFVSSDTTMDYVQEQFAENATLEAILITKDGEPNGNLVGIIRPRDLVEQ